MERREEEGERRQEEENSKKEDLEPPASDSAPPFGTSVMAAMPGLAKAANIMYKSGYKDGQGLGKYSQGIPQALVVEKISRIGGIIKSAENHQVGNSGDRSPPTGVPIA